MDVGAGDDFLAGDGLDGEGAVGFLADHAGDGAAVLEGEGMEFVIAAEDSAGVGDVFEEVIEVGAVGACEVWSDVAAVFEELVGRGRKCRCGPMISRGGPRGRGR